MKKLILVATTLFVVQVSFAQTEADISSNPDWTMVERMPSWMGCEKEQNENERTQCSYNKIQNYIKKNLQYPAEAKRQRLQGTVYMKFVVDNNGEVKKVEVANGISEELNNEAIRLITNMPRWNPGIQRGKPVPVLYTLPIKFSLNSKK